MSLERDLMLSSRDAELALVGAARKRTASWNAGPLSPLMACILINSSCGGGNVKARALP